MLKATTDVQLLHNARLLVHPYTFRGPTTAVLRRPLDEVRPDGVTVRSEIIADIRHYLYFGIDGGFTDYPAVWKEATR